MLAFYQQLLGLEVVRTFDVMETSGVRLHFLRIGDSHLKILEMRDPPAASNPPEGVHGATGFRYFTLWVESLDAVLERVEPAGGRLAAPVMEYGESRVALIEDPEGNWVEVVQGEP